MNNTLKDLIDSIAVSNTTNSLTVQQLQAIHGGITVGLSADEKVELETLQSEHTAETKKNKLDIFKKLPTDLRQNIINHYLWMEVIAEMNNTKVPKSPRLLELEDKHSFNRAGVIQTSDSYYFPHFYPLPESITMDDLKAAHLEASVEEELLQTQDPK